MYDNPWKSRPMVASGYSAFVFAAVENLEKLRDDTSHVSVGFSDDA